MNNVIFIIVCVYYILVYSFISYILIKEWVYNKSFSTIFKINSVLTYIREEYNNTKIKILIDETSLSEIIKEQNNLKNSISVYNNIHINDINNLESRLKSNKEYLETLKNDIYKHKKKLKRNLYTIIGSLASTFMVISLIVMFLYMY